MTEKEYKKMISEIDLDVVNKDKLNNIYEKYLNLFEGLTSPFEIKNIKKGGIFQSQMAINKTNYFNILLDVTLENPFNLNYHFKLIKNEILKLILLNTEISSYEVSENILKIKNSDVVVNLELMDSSKYEIALKKYKFIEEVSIKYTLFKNVFKIIRNIIDELNIEVINDYMLIIIMTYSLDKYYQTNKYDNYIMNIANGLEDFINSKKIEIQSEYNSVSLEHSMLTKGYVVIDPFALDNNLAKHINEANVSEFRKLKKRLAKLYEEPVQDYGSGSILKLNINPQKNPDGTLSWNYDVVGRNLSNSGGEYKDNIIEDKSASLKALFKGLKAITTSNIYNKNITVITKHKDLLKCIEKDQSESENNSRRKTITKYINDNKLIISFQIVG